jgi:RimJ/RimL family protein N-acetyltransferase
VAGILDDGHVRLRRAVPGDAPFVLALARHPEVEPFMAPVGPRTPEDARERIERGLADPAVRGIWIVEAEQGRPAGCLAFDTTNARSRIAGLSGVMVHPRFRRRGVGERAARLLARHLIDDLGFHRVQLECYGFNVAAVRLFERAGFTREGVRRRAYRRHGEWADGVLFGLLAEDLEEEAARGDDL